MMGEIGLYTPLGTTWYHLVPLQSAKWYPCFNARVYSMFRAHGPGTMLSEGSPLSGKGWSVN